MRSLIACLSLVVACESTSGKAPASAPAGGAASVAIAPIVLSTTIPADAIAVIALADLKPMTAQGFAMFGMDAAMFEPAIAEVVALVKRRIGFDVRRFGAVQAFVLPGGEVAAVLAGIGDLAPAIGKLPVPELAVAAVGADLVVGQAPAVAAAQAGGGFAKAKPELATLFAAQTEGAIAVAVAEPARLPLPADVSQGLRAAAVSIGTRGLRGVALGDAARLGALATEAKQQLDRAAAELARVRAAADDPRTPLPEAISAVFGAGLAAPYLKQVVVRATGDRLEAEVPMPGSSSPMMTVSTIGILAAVAIPAFMEYMQRGQASSARIHLVRIGKAAKVYFVEYGHYPEGQANSGAGMCCEQPGQICTPDTSDWSAAPWQALEFTVDEPIGYRFAYEGTKEGFRAMAIGGRDCSQAPTAVEISGSIGADGQPVVTSPAP